MTDLDCVFVIKQKSAFVNNREITPSLKVKETLP